MEDINQWRLHIQNRVHAPVQPVQPRDLRRCIFQIPPGMITEHNRNYYHPKMVSLGPFHHGNEILEPMQLFKESTIINFIRRSGIGLDVYMASLSAKLQDIINAYDNIDIRWTATEQNRENLMKMMLLDGCFILEVMNAHIHLNQYANTVLNYHGILKYLPDIRKDMLVLENQIPFLVLQLIFSVSRSCELNDPVMNNLMTNIHAFFGFSHIPRQNEGLHLLAICGSALMGNLEDPLLASQRNRLLLERERQRQRPNGRFQNLCPATELEDIGIHFEISETCSIMDVSFKENILSCPLLTVHSDTKSLFLNLMIFERLYPLDELDFNSYVYCTSSIMKCSKDISLLRRLGIVQNDLGTDEEVWQLFSDISKDALLDARSMWGVLFNQMHTRTRELEYERLKGWRSILRKFWTRGRGTVQTIATILVFCTAVIQCIYAILNYHKK